MISLSSMTTHSTPLSSLHGEIQYLSRSVRSSALCPLASLLVASALEPRSKAAWFTPILARCRSSTTTPRENLLSAGGLPSGTGGEGALALDPLAPPLAATTTALLLLSPSPTAGAPAGSLGSLGGSAAASAPGGLAACSGSFLAPSFLLVPRILARYWFTSVGTSLLVQFLPANPSSQMHLPSVWLHVPCPEHGLAAPPAHSREQLYPDHPRAQWHVPLCRHIPLPLQLSGQGFGGLRSRKLDTTATLSLQ
mmetsp:Transcript_26014/g.65644  ORF Transcript_26014/g.65644 Transcript_26014/m.65644 type:complete len:252 (-) Transcript_26014:177-932(-)